MIPMSFTAKNVTAEKKESLTQMEMIHTGCA